jgi:uncharacterized protein
VIRREWYLNQIRHAFRTYPVVALIGARQVGKTTLAREFARDEEPVTIFDLEDPNHASRLNDPMLALESLRGLVILDEIQRTPDVFSVLRVLADRTGRPARFLVLGSASPDLLRQSSESLAGRIHYLEVEGFRVREAGVEAVESLWVRGGFPRAFLAGTESDSVMWREDFLRTFLERDLPQFGISIDPITMRRFWTMVAHYHGQVWNGAEIARSLGIGATSVRRYLDIMTSALVIDQLQPWFANVGKRLVKSPKVFVRDTGILHSLLGIDDLEELLGHPKVGASWEGFAMEQVISTLELRRSDCFFWATHNGAEIDLVVARGQKRWGFEFKRTSQPKATRSMSIAIEDLGLRQVTVVHAGRDSFPLAKKASAVALANIATDLELK